MTAVRLKHTYQTFQTQMFIARKYAQRTLARPLRRTASPTQLQIRYASTRILNEQLEAENDLAQQLRDTGLWTSTKGKRNLPGDKHRVNIINKGLCGELVHYPSK